MNVFVVYWHPEPQSFNHAMFRMAQETLTDAGHEVAISDLHTMQFNPISSRENFTTVNDAAYLKLQLEEIHATENNGFALDIVAEMEKIEACDLMIWQFPLWWFGMPAVLKGWVDRVFAMGRVYGGGHIYDTGVFRGKRAMLSLTTGGPADAYRKGAFNGDIDAILRPVHRGMLQFVGFDVLTPQIVYGPARMSPEERTQQLTDYAERLRQITDESPIEVGIY
ncbi:MAG: NAD(P)H-dependent oxidoreductase [Chloroflexota bacterium]